MATGYVVPSNSAQDLATLAAALDAQLNITAAAVDPGSTKVARVEVTGTAAVDITNAITAVGDCVLQPGTAIA